MPFPFSLKSIHVLIFQIGPPERDQSITTKNTSLKRRLLLGPFRIRNSVSQIETGDPYSVFKELAVSRPLHS